MQAQQEVPSLSIKGIDESCMAGSANYEKKKKNEKQSQTHRR
jgi:hypothetical protein